MHYFVFSPHPCTVKYFPDRFIRREIKNLIVICPFSEAGCNWEGNFEKYHVHIQVCEFKSALRSSIQHFTASYGQAIDDLVQCDSKIATKKQKNDNNMIAREMGQPWEKLLVKSLVQDSLQIQITKLEYLNTELENLDFRLSLVENSSHDGSMIWKIPQFSQRKGDAENGKYTSIFSLPFYSGRYGYKMCLRLYIMGDGIGKGTHLSLFFVVMRGEFDNILQWPFTHKVTFKLINQAGGRDIVDTFQPDPLSSSFRKPKSDMNIASGCPQFVSHTELERGGFVVDNTIFIKCIIDISTIYHP